MSFDQIFDDMWNQYIQLNPKAHEIHSLLEKRGDKVINDHVAYRSLRMSGLGIDPIAKVFEDRGYKRAGEYNFELKKLYAVHLEHENKSLPKIFISELLVEEFSLDLQNIFNKLANQVNPESLKGEKILTAGRPWKVSHEEYKLLSEESEYAGWLAAFGYCANHFTVDVNELKSFKSLEDVNAFLINREFVMNESGGIIKGSKEVFLEQSSTMAHKLVVDFEDGSHRIPSCYYEFAKRHELPDGSLYQGFVTGSADKIFESTNKY